MQELKAERHHTKLNSGAALIHHARTQGQGFAYRSHGCC